jgi:hypothetical protein
MFLVLNNAKTAKSFLQKKRKKKIKRNFAKVAKAMKEL